MLKIVAAVSFQENMVRYYNLACVTHLSINTITNRGAESRGWARGQLKYYASLVLCSPQQARKMAHSSPDFQVISKKKRKKVFTEIETVFLSEFMWFQKKKVFRISFRWALWSPLGPLMGPFKLMGPLQSMGPGVIVPPAPLSEALIAISEDHFL